MGEINRKGFVYKKILSNKKTLYLPKNKRSYFQKPIGKLLIGSFSNHAWAVSKASRWIAKTKPSLIITVGDITTQGFLNQKITPNLAVFDYRCQREPIYFNLHQKLEKSMYIKLRFSNGKNLRYLSELPVDAALIFVPLPEILEQN